MNENDFIDYKILIDAVKAVEQLRELAQGATTFTERLELARAAVKRFNDTTGYGLRNTANAFKDLDEGIATTTNTSRLFGSESEAGWNRAGAAAESGAGKWAAGLHLVRIALGALEAMLLFNIVQAIQTAFGTAIKNAQELEASLYRIHNAERILSGEGISVTTKGLEDGIKRIKALLPIFSKEDITGLIGQVAITTKSLKLNEDQIVALAQSIAVMNVNSAENESLQQTAQKVMSSLLTSNAKGVANLGLKLGDAAIEAEAFKEGILKAGESISDLSDHEKSIVKVNLAIQNGNDSLKGMNEFLESNTGRIQANKAAWNDLLTTIGQVLLPFLPAATKLFQLFNDGFNTLKAIIVTVMAVLETFLVTARLVANGSIKSFDDLKNKFNEVAQAARKMFLNIFFPEGMPTNAPNWFKKVFGGDFKTPETPTATGIPNPDEVTANDNKAKMIQETEQKIQDIMRESADKKADIEREYGDKLQDIATNYSQKLEDIARETAQKRADALTDYNQKVDDINRDSAQKIADAQRDWRQKEIDRQKEFQNRMRELRDKFLMDLEDALHERDARQVLRLIRQYALDKKNLEEKAKLDRQQAKKDLQAKLQDIEIERQRKLEAAQREYQDKLQQIAIGEARARSEAQIWQQRALADANLWHQRQLQEQQQYLQRKLRDLANAIMQEYNLTAQGAQAVYSLLNSYFGAGGMTSNLMSGFNASLGGGGTSAGVTPVGQSPGIGSGLYNPYDVRTPRNPYFGHAEGGTLVATRPTQALFGENGPEIVSFTPLTRPGNDVGKIFGDKSALGGMGGDMKIRLELSPDLEARIIDSSMENVAVHIERIDRSK